MILSKTLIGAILALLSAMTARLVQDELSLRALETQQSKWIAQQLADREEAEKFRRDFEAAKKKAPFFTFSNAKNW